MSDHRYGLFRPTLPRPHPLDETARVSDNPSAVEIARLALEVCTAERQLRRAMHALERATERHHATASDRK